MEDDLQSFIDTGNTEFNTDAAYSKFDTQMSLASQITGSALATVVDGGASIYNSLMPMLGAEEVETADLLRRISKDASVMYEEHPDAIQAASLIGTSFLPMGLALKGMSAIRTGAKGASWFSNAGKAENMAKVNQAMLDGLEGTSTMRSLNRTLLSNGVANNLVDAAVTEAAMLATMSAHPLLEDYWDDPIKNMGLSLAFGGAIGGGLGHIADRAAIKKLKGDVLTGVNTEVTKDLVGYGAAEPNLGKLQIVNSNIKTLSNILSPDYNANEAVKQLAQAMHGEQVALQTKLFEEAIPSEWLALPIESRNKLMDLVLANPEFSSVSAADGIKFFKVTEDKASKIGSASVVPLSAKNTATRVVDAKTNEVTDITDSVFHQEWNSFSSTDDAIDFGRANMLHDKDTILTVDAQGLGAVPRNDVHLSVALGSSPEADSLYLSTLAHTARKKLSDINVLATDDIPLFDALLARHANNPDEFIGKKFKVTNAQASFDAYEKATLAHNPVKASHIDDLRAIAHATSPYNIAHSGSSLSAEAKDLLHGWIQNSRSAKAFLRNGVEKFARGAVHTDADMKAKRIADEMVNSTETKALKVHLKANVADKDGYVYMYRGQDAGRRGHSAIESYTPNKRVAEGFDARNTQLYKIHTDDIIGYVNGMNEQEFLVGSAKHPTVASVPTGDATKQAGFKAFSGAVTKPMEYLISDVKDLMIKQKENLLNSMIGTKPMEYIAIHTNLPIDTVRAFVMGKDVAENSLVALEKQGYSLSHYKDIKGIDAYLDPTGRPLRIKHSVNKIKYADMMTSLDTKSLATLNSEFLANTMYSSKSSVMREMAQKFFGNDVDPQGLRPAMEMLRSGVGEFNNAKLGNPFVQSADFFLRDTSVGKIVTYIGKTIQDLATENSTKIVLPIAQKMAVVVADEVKLTQSLTLLNILDGHAGWRDVVNGVLVTKAKKDVTKIVNGITHTVKEEELVPILHNGVKFEIKDPDVLDLVDAWRSAGREFYEMKNTTNSMTGRGSLKDLGLWTPSVDFRNKHLAYVFDKTNQKTSILWGTSEEHLKTNIADYMKVKGLSSTEEIITNKELSGNIGGTVIKTKAQQEQWNILHGRNDPLTMTVANVDKLKTGSAQDNLIKLTADRLSEMKGAYENLIESHIKRSASYMMHDTLDVLDSMSNYNQMYGKNQPLDNVFKFLKKGEDGAAKVRNVLLGNNNVSQYVPWKHYNENFEIVVNGGLGVITDTINAMVSPFGGKLGLKGKVTPENLARLDYETYSAKLEAAGVPNPFVEYDNAMARELYGKAKLTEGKDVAKRLVYAGNAFAATVALRFMDIASPLVNAVSMPILMSLAKAQNLPATFMGAKKLGSSDSVIGVMYDGIRLSNSTAGESLAKRWEKEGHFTSFVTEANHAMRMTRSFNNDAASKLENLVNNKFVDLLSKPADYTETLIRRKTMFTGYVLAKKLYPELGDTGATIFARDFMDRAVGNYHSGQRPVMFQGTMGVAMGLFQTYMLTLAQNIYRGVEMKDYKTIGKAMLAQSTIFGAGSMPGFDIVSQAIGDNFSEENIDLTTGTFRALPNSVATGVLYGLPSSMGPALYTRGDISPRLPSPTDITALAGVNMAKQTVEFGGNLVKAAKNNGGNIPNAMLQALSLQSVSRPLARWSELATGNSVSKFGDVYANSTEVRDASNWMSIASRVIGARPIEEAKAREGLFLDKTYGRIDREHRMKTTSELKLAIRAGTLDNDKLEELAGEYMSKNGSATGWRQAVNNAIAQSNMTGKEVIMNKLSPDTPIMHMMDSLDGEVVE